MNWLKFSGGAFHYSVKNRLYGRTQVGAGRGGREQVKPTVVGQGGCRREDR